MIASTARSRIGRAALLNGLRSAPWRASETEVLALRDGFAECDGFWQLLWWGILADLPTGLERIDCPVILAQGTLDMIASGQTARYLGGIAGARFVPLVGAGHAAQSDTPGAILQLVHRATTAAAERASRPVTTVDPHRPARSGSSIGHRTILRMPYPPLTSGSPAGAGRR